MKKSDIRNDHSANAVTGNLFVAAQAGQATVSMPGDPDLALAALRRKSDARRGKRDETDETNVSTDNLVQADDSELLSNAGLDGTGFASSQSGDNQPLRYAQVETGTRTDAPSSSPAKAPELEVIPSDEADSGFGRVGTKVLLGGAVVLGAAAAGGGGGGGGGGGSIIDTVTPQIAKVEISGATGAQNDTLNAGDVIEVTLTVSRAVRVVGTPTIDLRIGDTVVKAAYTPGSEATSTTLKFTYTVLAGQNDANGISVVAGSLAPWGAITDALNNYQLAPSVPLPGVADDPMYMVDTIAPGPATIDSPIAGDNIINANEETSQISGACETGSIVVLSLGGITRTADTVGTRWTYDLTAADIQAMGQGSKTITATPSDAAGNAGPAASRTITVDTTVVAASINPVAGDDRINITEAAAGLSITGRGKPGATVTLTFDSGRTLAGGNSAVVNGNGDWSLVVTSADIAFFGQGTETITARQVDTAGNVTVGSRTIAVDTQVAAPTLDLAAISDSGLSGTDNYTNVTTPVFTVTGEAGAVVTLFNDLNGNGLVDASETLGTVTLATTSGSITSSLLTQGVYNAIKVIQTDAAGNTSVASAAHAPITIDTAAPMVSSIAITSATGIQNNSLNAGDVVTITVTMSEAVTVTGAPTLTLTIGATPVVATYNAAASTSTLLRFNYTILATQTDANGISIGANSLVLNGGAINDLAGNAATITHLAVADNPLYMVDTTAPTVSIVAITSATGILNNTLNAGDVVTATVTMNEAVTVTGAPTLTLTIGSTAVVATYNAAASTPTLLRFNYTILAGQTDTNGISIGANSLALNGGTINDLAGNAATITHVAVADNPLYMVDTTPPAPPTISVVAGDDTINAAERGAGVTITGGCEAGSTVALTFGTPATAHAATVAGTTWSYLLTAADYTAMGEGAETLSAQATDVAGNVSTIATRPITIATGASTDHVMSVGITSATGSQNSTLNAGDVVTATVTMSESTTVTGSPTLTLTVGSASAIATYNAAGSTSTLIRFNYTIQGGEADSNGISIAANSLNLNGGTILDASTNPASLTHSAVGDNSGFLVDTTAPAASIISAVATDDIINSAERTATVTVTGTNETGATTTLNGNAVVQDTATTWHYVLSAAAIDAFGQGLETLTAISTDAAGNSNTASRNISVDTNAPTCFINDNLLGTSDGLTPVTFTFQFSEAVTGFDSLSDISVLWGGTTGTTDAAPTPIVGNAYTLAVTPPVTGGATIADLTVDIVAVGIMDAAGNLAVSLGADVQPYYVLP